MNINHELCGRCAYAWITERGRTTPGSLGRLLPPPPNYGQLVTQVPQNSQAAGRPWNPWPADQPGPRQAAGQPRIQWAISPPDPRQAAGRPWDPSPADQPDNRQAAGQPWTPWPAIQPHQAAGLPWYPCPTDQQAAGRPHNRQMEQRSDQPEQERGDGRCPTQVSYLKDFTFFFGGADKGRVNGSTNPSPTYPAEQRRWQTVTNPAKAWQPPNNSPDPTPNAGAPTIPLALGMTSATSIRTRNTSGGTSNWDNRPRFGPFNGAYPVSLSPPTDWDPGSHNDKSRLGPFNGGHLISLPPAQPSSSGTLVLQALNSTNPDPTLPPKPGDVLMELSPLSPPPVAPPVVTETPARTWTMGSGWDEVAMGDADTQSSNLFVYPPPTSGPVQIGTHGLPKGCSKPAFVNPITDPESEYHSRKHQE